MRIDTSLIDGYADMSAEEKIKALEALELADPDYSGYVKKEVFDKTASELASKKKELNEKLSETERANKEREESDKQLRESYEALLRDTNISKATAKFLSLGYDEKLASETAIAYVDGDTDKVFANQAKAMQAFEKKIKSDVLKDTPKPVGGEGKGMTKSDFNKMSSEDRIAWAMKPENAEEYKSIIGGSE